MHLSDEQFENAVNDTGAEAAHLAGCAECRRRLEALRAVQQRLRSAFTSVSAPAALVKQIRAAAGLPQTVRAPQFAGDHRPLVVNFRKTAMLLAAAAVIALVAVPLAIVLTGAPSAQAAQQQLVQIHQQNLTDGHDFYSESEPAKLAQYFKDKLGFVPAMPTLNQGMAIRGCCVAYFRDKIAGSYVVDTPDGVVSIIVVKDPPNSLGLTPRSLPDGRVHWEGRMAMCNMAAVRMGEFTYTAVSAAPRDSLTQMLDLLVQ